ncbi:MAG: hypothetical protein SGILL_004113 [Bacillariaceae sp.]
MTTHYSNCLKNSGIATVNDHLMELLGMNRARGYANVRESCLSAQLQVSGTVMNSTVRELTNLEWIQSKKMCFVSLTKTGYVYWMEKGKGKYEVEKALFSILKNGYETGFKKVTKDSILNHDLLDQYDSKHIEFVLNFMNEKQHLGIWHEVVYGLTGKGVETLKDKKDNKGTDEFVHTWMKSGMSQEEKKLFEILCTDNGSLRNKADVAMQLQLQYPNQVNLMKLTTTMRGIVTCPDENTIGIKRDHCCLPSEVAKPCNNHA